MVQLLSTRIVYHTFDVRQKTPVSFCRHNRHNPSSGDDARRSFMFVIPPLQSLGGTRDTLRSRRGTQKLRISPAGRRSLHSPFSILHSSFHIRTNSALPYHSSPPPPPDYHWRIIANRFEKMLALRSLRMHTFTHGTSLIWYESGKIFFALVSRNNTLSNGTSHACEQ